MHVTYKTDFSDVIWKKFRLFAVDKSKLATLSTQNEDCTQQTLDAVGKCMHVYKVYKYMLHVYDPMFVL